MNETVELIGQIVGFVAIIVAMLSFQAKSRSGILVLQGIANGVWVAHFFMIGAPMGAIMNFLCFVRNLLYAMKNRWKWVNNIITPIVFSVVAITVSIITQDSWTDFLILPSTIVSSLAYYMNDERKIRGFTFFVSGSWLIFNVIEFSISGVIAEIFNLTSLTIATFRYSKRRVKNKLEKEKNTDENAIDVV